MLRGGVGGRFASILLSFFAAPAGEFGLNFCIGRKPASIGVGYAFVDSGEDEFLHEEVLFESLIDDFGTSSVGGFGDGVERGCLLLVDSEADVDCAHGLRIARCMTLPCNVCDFGVQCRSWSAEADGQFYFLHAMTFSAGLQRAVCHEPCLGRCPRLK
jgi:hypothetical protein